MTYTAAAGRQRILDQLAIAAEQIARSIAMLSEAYEHLDDYTAERLEASLFRPLQAAYGRAKRVHAAFAERSGLAAQAFAQPSQAAPASTTQSLLESASQEATVADGTLAELQDSMLPVEVGDVELRKGLTEVREQLAGVKRSARELLRTLGR